MTLFAIRTSTLAFAYGSSCASTTRFAHGLGSASDLDGVRLRSEVMLHPREALAEQELQVRASALLVFVARAKGVTGVSDEDGGLVVAVMTQAGRRPHTKRVRPMIASAAAVDQAIADTSGASKSVPD